MSHIATHNEHLQANTWYRLTARVTLAGTTQVWKRHYPTRRWRPDVCAPCGQLWPCPTESARKTRLSHIRQAYARRRQ